MKVASSAVLENDTQRRMYTDAWSTISDFCPPGNICSLLLLFLGLPRSRELFHGRRVASMDMPRPLRFSSLQMNGHHRFSSLSCFLARLLDNLTESRTERGIESLLKFRPNVQRSSARHRRSSCIRDTRDVVLLLATFTVSRSTGRSWSVMRLLTNPHSPVNHSQKIRLCGCRFSVRPWSFLVAFEFTRIEWGKIRLWSASSCW